MFGTSGNVDISDDQARPILGSLGSVSARSGVADFNPPFHYFVTFGRYWRRNGASGSWQASREMLDSILEPLQARLDEIEAGSITSTLAQAISPRRSTGWPGIEEEHVALRRHFESARTQQDDSKVGNDCVEVIEAVSRVAYYHNRHGKAGQPEPPSGNTKDRLDRVVEEALVGSTNAEMRKLVRAAIAMAQAVKHRRSTTTRTEAGASADTVILLANFIRRIHGDQLCVHGMRAADVLKVFGRRSYVYPVRWDRCIADS